LGSVLAPHGIPVTPGEHRIFQWLPEPLLLAWTKRMIGSDAASSKLGLALGARQEMKTLADEFRILAENTPFATPAMDRLHRHLGPTVEPIADGSADLSPRWLR
jgi:hypothetical protein